MQQVLKIIPNKKTYTNVKIYCASSCSSCFKLKPRTPEGQPASPAGRDIFAFSFLGCHAGCATSGGSFDIVGGRLGLKRVLESLHTRPGTVDAVIETLVRRFTFANEVATEHPEQEQGVV